MMLPTTLSDGVVTLRPWRSEDAQDVHRMVQDPEIPRFMSIPSNHTLEGVKRWLSGRDEGWQAGDDLAFAIESADDGILLGSAGLEVSSDDPAIGEVGYWVAAESRGRGIAQRAVALISRWAFDVLELERLEITTHPENLKSQRVAEANGYRREGVLRAYRGQHGQRIDLVMLARLRDDAT
ncbi:MAG TPA: GNAT family N-acetyltransferase [Coriobacteriia bacterium]|nr:GNAT family N-acetyltransferase [Coriobacteriia bacterium]